MRRAPKAYLWFACKTSEISGGPICLLLFASEGAGSLSEVGQEFVGPYLIVRIIEPVNAVIQKSKGLKLITVHIDKLKLYHGPELKPWIVLPNSTVEAVGQADKELPLPLPVHMEPPVDPIFEAEDVVDSSVVDVENGVQGHQGVVESPDAVPPIDTPPKHPYNVTSKA